MSEQARQDALNVRIDAHTGINDDLAGYFYNEVQGEPNPEAYLRAIVSDVARDAELTNLLDALDAGKVVHDATTRPLAKLRFKRDCYLKETDHMLRADAPYTAQEVADYTVYRTYLRDLPAQDPLPADVDDFATWLAAQ